MELLTEKEIRRCVEIASGLEDIAKNTRKRTWVEARMVYYKICRELSPPISYRISGEELGRDHATALHGERKYNEQVSTSRTLQRLYQDSQDVISSKGIIMLNETAKEKKELLDHMKQMKASYEETISELYTEVLHLRKQDEFIKSVKMLSPKEYAEFKERGELIIRSMKSRRTYDNVDKSEFNIKSFA